MKPDKPTIRGMVYNNAVTREKGCVVPSIIGDVAIHVRNFVPIVQDLHKLMCRNMS